MGKPEFARQSLDLARAAAEGVPVMIDALELVDRHVGADTLSMSELRLRDGAETTAELQLHRAAPLGPEELDLWPRLMPTHPYLPHLVQGPMCASRVTDVVDLRVFERSELYERLLAPRGSRYQAALLLGRSRTSLQLFSLWRCREDFTDAEVRALEAFREVMAAALAFAGAVERASRDLDGAPTAAGRGGADGDADADADADGHHLSRRRRQVAVLVEAGLTNDQIATRLGISSRTVRKHVADLFVLTGSRSRVEVAVRWRQGGRTAISSTPR